MSTHLSGGRLNVAILQETMRKELLNLLQLCEGKKVTGTIYSEAISLSSLFGHEPTAH